MPPSAEPDALVAYSREVIRSGSKSFAAAATLFDPRTRASAYLLYAWCRHCDDEVDGQSLGHGAAALDPETRRARVETLFDQTRAALRGEPVEHPVFQAFQAVARAHALPPAFAYDHLEGFRLDADGVPIRTEADLLRYCYHVAGVVGLMMAWIMGVRNEATLDRACDLGMAFQLTNIARDVVEDAQVGRVYLPKAWLREGGLDAEGVGRPENRDAAFALAQRLVALAEPYYASARWGMARLPFRSAWAVGAARGVYRRIGRKLLRLGPVAWDDRLSTTKGEKLQELIAGGAAAARAVTLGRLRRPPARGGLWARPGRRISGDGLLTDPAGLLQPVDGEQPI
jgi:phytoene synthase